MRRLQSNEATVFLTQIVEGKMQKVNCARPARRKGRHDPTGFALADLLLGLGAAQEIEKGAPTQKCPVCGFTQADFKKTGRLGCAHAMQLSPKAWTRLLKTMHKGTEHVGKVPQRAHRELRAERSHAHSATTTCSKAVAEENYETAAAFRDEIKQLEARDSRA